MSIIRSEDSRKWIYTFLVIVSAIITFLLIRFLEQMGEWFDLEAKIGNFVMVSQGVSILIGFSCFMFMSKYKSVMIYLEEVYSELTKAVWPDKDSVVKITVGLIVSLTVISLVFVLVDNVFRFILKNIYQ